LIKILYIIDSLKAGGKERQLVELIKGLSNNQKFIIEICVMNKRVHYTEVNNLNIKIHYLIRSSKKDIRIFSKIYFICKNFSPDIIHTWDTMTAFYSLPVAKLLKIKIIDGSIRNATGMTMLSWRYFHSKILSHCFDKVISNSKAGLDAYNIHGNTGTFIYNGFDQKRIQNLSSKKEIKNKLGIKNKIVIGMVGSFTPKKDWFTFINCALEILSTRDDLIFIGVGDGPIFEEIKTYSEKYLGESIILVKNYHPIEELINVFHIGVLTTNSKYHKEGISNSIMEYMALGKPTIATNSGGNIELIVHNDTGFLINKNDIQSLKKRILYLSDNSEVLISMGNSSKKRIKKYFSNESMINNYINIYK